jgi:hypothetical protein
MLCMLCAVWTLTVSHLRLSRPIAPRPSSMVILLSAMICLSRSPVKPHREWKRWAYDAQQTGRERDQHGTAIGGCGDDHGRL